LIGYHLAVDGGLWDAHPGHVNIPLPSECLNSVFILNAGLNSVS